MKKVYFCFLFFVAVGITQTRAQTPPVTSFDSATYLLQLQVYSAATKYNDPEVARMALYNLLMMNPGATAIADTLALLYFQSQRYVSVALITQDILNGNPKDELAQEIGAYSYEQLGLDDKALPLYESIYLRNNDIVTLYKIALIQFKLERLEECSTNFDIILSKREADSVNLYFADANNQQQKIPMRAAVLNMKGLLAKSLEKKEEASKFYRQALLISPDFHIAKLNLEDLEDSKE